MKATDPTTQPDHWDLVIQPKGSFLNLNLKEVWKYRDLLVLFVRRDFVASFKQTVLGPLWHVIQPVLTTIMFLFVFGTVAKIPTDGIPPVLFYMSGISIWNYFNACLMGTSGTFVANAGMFGKVYFPRLVIPLSVVASNIVKLLIQFALLVAVFIYYAFHGYTIHAGWALLLLPLLVVMMALMGLGLGIIFSSLTTKYRDFSVLLGFGMQLLMYATPIAYPLSYLQNKSYKWILDINPLTSIVEMYRYALFGKGLFTATSVTYSCIFIVVVVLGGIVLFNKVERTFIDTV
ncbi:MAG: ABC transporter permease [Bacteroidetes bacterium]|nr:ABC transporter permease [Bacteroidota bacterium]